MYSYFQVMCLCECVMKMLVSSKIEALPFFSGQEATSFSNQQSGISVFVRVSPFVYGVDFTAIFGL